MTTCPLTNKPCGRPDVCNRDMRCIDADEQAAMNYVLTQACHCPCTNMRCMRSWLCLQNNRCERRIAIANRSPVSDDKIIWAPKRRPRKPRIGICEACNGTGLARDQSSQCSSCGGTGRSIAWAAASPPTQ